jgi:hypothetical protein
MKIAFIGVVAVVAAACVVPTLAEAEASSYRAQFYVSANRQNLEPIDPYVDVSHYRDWQSGNAAMLYHANEAARYCYHGGPKSND